ncbi:hypothetical protein AYI69_g3421 [Smittium culicis]|uniref:Uncharacterized protein n=1 Tax=Smittium culicis TaxID=133412 RepID=A0A1R1YK95_9FUNG|nr:hypothetical protein AYI69_g3421 [Smittium culicis]
MKPENLLELFVTFMLFKTESGNQLVNRIFYYWNTTCALAYNQKCQQSWCQLMAQLYRPYLFDIHLDIKLPKPHICSPHFVVNSHKLPHPSC